MKCRAPLLMLLAFLAARPGHAQDGSRSRDEIRAAADTDTAMRVVISLKDRELRVISQSNETLRVAPVAVGSGRRLRANGSSWRFRTPTGISTVVEKQENPAWIAPDWHYIEAAHAGGYAISWLAYGEQTQLGSGRVLEIRNDTVGIRRDTTFTPIRPGHDIVIGGVLYVPPLGAANRAYAGILGTRRLVLDNGVGIHGTNEPASIGKAVTHGCIRASDADIEWVYDTVPIGTRVYIY
jgi:lipoprotein-anchoring transpeptidase ErfK/SrfK